MRKKIFIGLGVVAAIIGLFCIYVALQPADFTISRSATIAAPPADVFAQVNDFHNWQEWSPWAKIDPNAKATFEGPDSGEGAIFRWEGNSDIGEGSMTIVESKPNEQIKIKLAFIKPMPGESDTLFTFEPVGEKTKATWTMYGKNNFIGRVFCTFMNMQKMIGDKFDEGLESIRSIVEPKSSQPAP